MGNVVGRGYALDTQPQRFKTALNKDRATPNYPLGPLPYDFSNDPTNVNIGKDGNGNVIFPQEYKNKTIRVLNIDLTNIFDNQFHQLPGSMIFFSGQNGGTAAPLMLRYDAVDNDQFSFPYDRAISGIPFDRFYLSNPTAQPGVSAEIIVVNDAPFDRIGLNG